MSYFYSNGSRATAPYTPYAPYSPYVSAPYAPYIAAPQFSSFAPVQARGFQPAPQFVTSTPTVYSGFAPQASFIPQGSFVSSQYAYPAPAPFRGSIASSASAVTTVAVTPKVSSVAVFGASGNVGAATVKALAAKNLKVRAGIRNPDSDKAQPLKALAGVEVVAASLGDAASLDAAAHGVDAVFVNTPGDADRTALGIAGIKAAVRAGAKHVVVVSVSNADTTSETFGRQFAPIEAEAKQAGIPFTLLRLPLFFDNNWGHLQSIKGQGKMYGSTAPKSVGSAIAVSDIGEAAAVIIAEGPRKHGGKTYSLTAAPSSADDVAAAFAAALGKPVDYVQVPEAGVTQALLGMGMEDWQVEGVLELNRRIDAGTYVFPSDFKAIVGREPLTIQQWVAQVAGAFR
eukprot:TRINITY_DN221_c0_g1_i8.p1 TRINITY_DN221_c0_g1~~TRINITY_DN221_c0_g1_i8.p1  ORF type:complete len:414 (-),score=90.25 TRINITY_DN221_c0_g1_i8:59-1258(-)